MLNNDNVISTSVSEAVEKIHTDQKDYCKCSFMCFSLHSHSIQRADQHIVNSRNSCLPTPSAAKKITEDILHKIYTEKRCSNWHMISFIHWCGNEKRVYRFPSGSKLPDAIKEGG